MLLNKSQLSLVAILLGLTLGGSVPTKTEYAIKETPIQLTSKAHLEGAFFFDVATANLGLAESNFSFDDFSLVAPAFADVTAPQAPPELSDTLTDFRTKEQLTEQIYIEGKVDAQNSLQVPTAASDLNAKVMRLSALYQAQYEIAVPRYGASVVRFYDLEGTPVEILDITLDKSGYIAERTAATYELLLRQFQGAEETLLRVRFKRHRTPAILKLRPMVLVNQQQPVRTLITCLTLNFNAEQRRDKFEAYKFQQDVVMTNAQIPSMPSTTPDFSKVDQHKLEQALVQGSMVILPLTVSEQVDSQEILDKLAEPISEDR